MVGEVVKLPDLLRNWPWERHLNNNYEAAKALSLEWFKNFEAFDPKSQDAFDRCDFARLAMLAYLYPDLARCRTGTDLMTLFYAFDEYTDVEDEFVTRQMADMVMDGLRNTDKVRPLGECPLGEIARQFWSLGRNTATPMAERHLLDAMQLYVDAVVQQSEDRTHDRLRSIDDYWKVRYHSSGCIPSFAAMELEMDIPENIYQHPLLKRIRDCAVYLICAGNDLYSYHIECARGHALHNLVTSVMHEHELGPQAAADWISDWSDGILREFLECRASLPSWGPDIDTQITHYVDSLTQWVRGNDDWSFESQRYFGTMGAEVRVKRKIYMLPLVAAAESRAAEKRDEVQGVDEMGIAALQIRRDLQRVQDAGV